MKPAPEMTLPVPPVAADHGSAPEMTLPVHPVAADHEAAEMTLPVHPVAADHEAVDGGAPEMTPLDLITVRVSVEIFE